MALKSHYRVNKMMIKLQVTTLPSSRSGVITCTILWLSCSMR